jgi:NAD(P)-dependent dehydrogenase (short-subunit alcohol dehydrogenase family)
MSSIQEKNLQGKVALVTGASKGIGAAIARELAARGASVAVNYSGSKAAADKLVEEINSNGGKAIAVQANVAEPSSIQPLIDTVATQLGPIDVLVNNAGIYEFGPLEAITPEHFHKQFNVNVLGLAAGNPGRRHALQSSRWQHHQHRLGGRQNGLPKWLGLQRNQGRSRLHHCLALKGTGQRRFA